jgi:hypothetical protein
MRPRKYSREEAWRLFAQQHGGRIVTSKLGRVRSVRFTHGAWTVIFDTYTVSNGKSSTTYTRVRSLVRAHSDFRFCLYRENVLTRVGKLFGMQDIHAGHPEVDRHFIVKSNNESLIRSLILHPAVHVPLLAQRGGRFELARFRGKFRNRPEGIAQLRYTVAKVMKDPESLAGLLELMRGTLDQLARVGATSSAAVEYVL